MSPNVLYEYLKVGQFIKATTTNQTIIEGDIRSINHDVLILKTRTSIVLINAVSILSIELFEFDQPHHLERHPEVLYKAPAFQQETINKPQPHTQATLVEKQVAAVSIEEVVLEKENNFIEFDPTDIPWKEDGLPEEMVFKGRDALIDELITHYQSINRTKTYMLYGLTRTGKSSILKYLDTKILNTPVRLEKQYKFIAFNWDLSRAAIQTSAKDMWTYLLGACTADKIKKLSNEGKINISSADILHKNEYRATHLREIIILVKKHGYFPIFLIDEFTFYENLFKSKKVDASFLQTFRQLAFDKLACFVYAGAYTLKTLLRNKEYGLTGQLVNIKEEVVNGIDPNAARELINVFDKVTFSDQAVHRILRLSNKIPYFIQIICKNVAFYCLEKQTNNIDADQLEEVIKILVGDSYSKSPSMVERLSSGTFDSNQYDPSNQSYTALLATIAYLEGTNKKPKGVPYDDIANLWNKHNVKYFGQLQESIEDLIDRGILTSENSDTLPKYFIGVDLFRRWIKNEKADIGLALGKINNRK